MSDKTPWLATRVASLVPSLLPTGTAQGCIGVSSRYGSSTICSGGGSTTCIGGCCTYCWSASCYGRIVNRWMCGPC
jgi:hypothetical protein